MKIFYHCYGSSHSSVIAANIHVGNLPADRIPTWKEILSLRDFDKRKKDDIGRPIFIGQDERGNDIYIIGLSHQKNIPINAVYSFLSIFQIPKNEIIFVNALASINLITKIGGFLSRAAGIVFIGRPLAVIGIQTSYKNILGLVEKTKKNLENI